MSSTKLDTSGVFQPAPIPPQETQLTLPASSVHIHKNGIEFRTDKAIPVYTEMSVGLQSPGETRKINVTGVVFRCTGNRHSGFVVSMLFTNVPRQSQERLNMLAQARVA